LSIFFPEWLENNEGEIATEKLIIPSISVIHSTIFILLSSLFNWIYIWRNQTTPIINPIKKAHNKRIQIGI
jgi:hypothetical protein